MQGTHSGGHAIYASDIDGQVDIDGRKTVSSLIHAASIAEVNTSGICRKIDYASRIDMRRWRNVGRAARAAILCFYPVFQEAMYGKVKRLRERGKRMSDQQIASAPYVEGEVRVYGVGSVMEANVTDPNRQVGDPLLPTLFEARLTTMQGVSMLLKGEERPQGDTGPAYAQEWAIRFDTCP